MTTREARPGRAVGSGVGSLPGDDIHEALRLVVDELPDLPYLPELQGAVPPPR